MDIGSKILSDIVCHSKYANWIENEFRRESWDEIVDRQVAMHTKKFPHLEEEINWAFSFVRKKKILGSARVAQFGGKAVERRNARGYNCCFHPINCSDSFSETMYLLLCGCGVGFSVQKEHVDCLPAIQNITEKQEYIVGDSIEGWSDAVKVLLDAYLLGKPLPEFNFSKIRRKGSRISSGGIAPGAGPLRKSLQMIHKILRDKQVGEKLSPLNCYDILCILSEAVLSGGIRRSAMICLFSPDDEEMLSCKVGNWWEEHPYRGRANNSMVLLRDELNDTLIDWAWGKVTDALRTGSGDPGIYFTNNRSVGTNPCAEASLRSYQMCNLCEINGDSIEDQADFEEVCAAASFIGTLQSAYVDFNYLRPIWRKVVSEDALLGVGITGIACGKLGKLDLQAGARKIKEVNRNYAKLVGVNPSARTTVIKPSGTSTLLLGCKGSGIHAIYDQYYIRRMRISKVEPIYQVLLDSMPELMEDDVMAADTTAVFSVPIYGGDNIVTKNDESAVDFMERIKHFYQNWILPGHNYGDNTHNVSATVYVKPEEYEQVKAWIKENKELYCALSFLPYADEDKNYKQLPFESIDKSKYDELVTYLREINLATIHEKRDYYDIGGEAACSGTGSCEIVST